MSTLQEAATPSRRCHELSYHPLSGDSGLLGFYQLLPFTVDGISYDMHHADLCSWTVQPMLRVLTNEDGMCDPAVACLNCPLTEAELYNWVHDRWSDPDGPGCTCDAPGLA